MSQEEMTNKKAKLSFTSDSSAASASVPDVASPLAISGVVESDMPTAGPSGIDYATITSGTLISSTPAAKAPQAQCNRCKKHAKNRKAMKKKVDRLGKQVEKLKGKLNALKEFKVSFFISFNNPKIGMKFLIVYPVCFLHFYGQCLL